MGRLLAIAFGCSLGVTALAQPSEGFVGGPGVRLHYRSVGMGKPLVILSGGPGKDVRQLSDIVNGIDNLRRCVLFDQRGTGQSKLDRVDKETIKVDLYIQDVEALRKGLGLEKISLLGHSWGAMLAAAYAAKHPNRIDELILVDPGPLSYEAFAVAGDNITQRRGLLNAKSELNEGQALYELRPFFYDQKKAEVFAARSEEGYVSVVVSQFLIPEWIGQKIDTRPGLRKLRCRALMLQGRQDMMPESHLTDVQSCIKGCQLSFIERAGHFSWIEQPESFFKVLRAFLEKGR